MPLVFLTVGAFLPPASRPALRGVTFAAVVWVGFVPAFRPRAGALTLAAFLVVSLLGHLVYGAVLGVVLDRATGVPEHEI